MLETKHQYWNPTEIGQRDNDPDFGDHRPRPLCPTCKRPVRLGWGRGRLVFLTDPYEVQWDGKPLDGLDLTATEGRLFKCLIRRDLATRDVLCALLGEDVKSRHTLNAHLRNIRCKFEDVLGAPDLVTIKSTYARKGFVLRVAHEP